MLLNLNSFSISLDDSFRPPSFDVNLPVVAARYKQLQLKLHPDKQLGKSPVCTPHPPAAAAAQAAAAAAAMPVKAGGGGSTATPSHLAAAVVVSCCCGSCLR